MNLWLTMLAAGLATYAIRLSFILLWSRLPAPARLRRALHFVPPAVLTAIILPDLLLRAGALSLGLDNFRLLAGLLAALVAWRTRNPLLTILAGMLVFYLLQWLS
jgi:branched-subunit amino acid transport protein